MHRFDLTDSFSCQSLGFFSSRRDIVLKPVVEREVL